MELLGQGNIVEAGQIAELLDYVPSNTRVQLSFDLRASPAAWMVNQIQSILQSRGVPGVRVSTGSPVLNISWIHYAGVQSDAGRISMEPLTAIAIIIAAIAVISIVIIGWRLYSDVPGAVKGPLVTGLLIVLIAFVGTKAIRNLKKGG